MIWEDGTHMATQNQRAYPRYPLWLPVEARTRPGGDRRQATLCDLSRGGALVWGYWSEATRGEMTFSFNYRGRRFELTGDVVDTEPMWDTVLAHVRFADGAGESQDELTELLDDLRVNFEEHQKYLAFRADDDPGLARTATQYPGERASA